MTLKGPTLGAYISKGLQAYYLQAASIMSAGRCLQAGGTEGRPADLARSTAEGVGGLKAPYGGNTADPHFLDALRDCYE